VVPGEDLLRHDSTSAGLVEAPVGMHQTPLETGSFALVAPVIAAPEAEFEAGTVEALLHLVAAQGIQR